jgi:hypothetical protein
LYLNTLSICIKRTNPIKRTINPQSVWLYLIPIVGIFIYYNHINRINETLHNELSDRRLNKENFTSGFNAGKPFDALNIISFCINVCCFIYYIFSVSNINNDEFLYDNAYHETNLETFGQVNYCFWFNLSNSFGGFINKMDNLLV